METCDDKFAKPVTKHVIWRIRTEQELREEHKTPDLIANTNRKRLKELVNVIRTEHTEVSLLSD
jgi:3-phenylpropionate/cinnamic acid dioxygenase small subunit